MFDNIPDDVPEQYLNGAAAFVRSGGERDEDVSGQGYAWILNQIVGNARIESSDDNDARARQKVVPIEEAGDDALAPEEYTNNVFNSETESWAKFAMDSVESDD